MFCRVLGLLFGKLRREDGILLWGSRVVIPPQACETVIEQAHAAHIGIIRMRA